jgi:alkylhydroperoxidase family enzyme
VGNDARAGERIILLRRVAETLLDADDGALDDRLRAAAYAHAVAAAGRAARAAEPLPEPLGAFVDKVTRSAYKVVGRDVDGLRQAGFGDDAILEAVLAAAVGAGVARFEIGLDALAGRR